MHAADPLWMKVLLGVHITAGFSAFLLAPVALMTAKGGKAASTLGDGVSVVDGCRGGDGVAYGALSASVVSGAGGGVQFLCVFFGVACAGAERPGEGRKCEAD